MTKKLMPVAPHVFLSLLVITSPAHDVLPIVWTDYTYDPEHGVAEGIPPQLFWRSSSSRRGNLFCIIIYHYSEWSNVEMEFKAV